MSLSEGWSERGALVRVPKSPHSLSCPEGETPGALGEKPRGEQLKLGDTRPARPNASGDTKCPCERKRKGRRSDEEEGAEGPRRRRETPDATG